MRVEGKVKVMVSGGLCCGGLSEKVIEVGWVREVGEGLKRNSNVVVMEGGKEGGSI